MKKGNVTDIEEMIADAKAEEEVAREQEKAGKEQAFKNELREQLKDKLVDAVKANRESEKVTIDLYEYVILKQKEADLDRILNAIVDGLGLSYNNEYLYLKNDGRVSDTFRVLYPDVYDTLLAAELAQAENEG